MATAARPPRRFTSATVASSTKEMQSHRTLPAGGETSRARWPMANEGSVAIPNRPGPSSGERWGRPPAPARPLPGAPVAAPPRHQRRQAGPALPVPADVLALVIADRAADGRVAALGVLLDTARHADPPGLARRRAGPGGRRGGGRRGNGRGQSVTPKRSRSWVVSFSGVS